MPHVDLNEEDWRLLNIAVEEAQAGYREGGVAVGAALGRNGSLIARGRNGLVQEGNPVLHGETACLRNAGAGLDFSGMTLATSLSPCAMCAGAIILFGIPRVVVGENKNFAGEIDWLLTHGVEVALANDPDIVDFFAGFVRERSDLWKTDIPGYAD